MDDRVGGEVAGGPVAGLENVTLQMEGLSCSCEAQLVEKKVRSLAGIGSVDADGISQQLKVSYDPSLTNIQDIIRSVAETGRKCLSGQEAQKVRSTWWREKQQLALFGTALLILVAVGVRYLTDAPSGSSILSTCSL